MDDIEKILERLENLEKAINGLKEELHELKDYSAEEEGTYNRDSVRDVFTAFNDIYGLAHDLKRQMKRVFRPARRHQRHYYDRDDDFGFDFDFDFSHLGEFINNTVQSALSGLENLGESIDFEFTPRIARVKVQPGTNIRFDHESVNPVDSLPSINDIQYGKEILLQLQAKIASLESLASDLQLDQNMVAASLEQLKEKKVVIQEKYGAQRFMITKLGKKVLKSEEKQDKEDKTDE